MTEDRTESAGRWSRLRIRLGEHRWLAIYFGLALALALGLIGWAAVVTAGGGDKHPIDPLGSVILVLLPLFIVLRDLLRAWPDGAPAPWPLWLSIPIPLLGLGGALGLLLGDGDIARLAGQLGVLAAFALLPLLLVPRGLTLLRRAFSALPKIGPWLGGRASEPLLGVVIVTAFNLPLSVIAFLDASLYPEYAVAILLLLGLGLSIWQRRTLDPESGLPLLMRALPHMPAGLAPTFVVVALFWFSFGNGSLSLWDVFGNHASADAVAAILLSSGPVLLLGYLTQGLRRSVVDAIDDSPTQRVSSIQSDTGRYVDFNDRAARLIRALRGSDSGVFGVTGVRGAGKTALTRYCVQRLDGRYFTLELTAPIRHDADLGFLSSVCRGVCNRVLADLEPILRGRRSGTLWQRIRNWLVVVLLVIAAFSLWHGRIPSSRVTDYGSELTAIIGFSPQMIRDLKFPDSEGYRILATTNTAAVHW